MTIFSTRETPAELWSAWQNLSVDLAWRGFTVERDFAGPAPRLRVTGVHDAIDLTAVQDGEGRWRAAAEGSAAEDWAPVDDPMDSGPAADLIAAGLACGDSSCMWCPRTDPADQRGRAA
jgi:hypothetical protein